MNTYKINSIYNMLGKYENERTEEVEGNEIKVRRKKERKKERKKKEAKNIMRDNKFNI
jgi:hypothetical protein